MGKERDQNLFILQESLFCTYFPFWWWGEGDCVTLLSILSLVQSGLIPTELVLSPYDQCMFLKVSKPSG